MPCIELMGHKCWYAYIRVALCRLDHKSRSLFFANLETKSDSSRTHWYPISHPPDCAKIETIFGERPIPTFSLLRIFVWSPVFPWRELVSIHNREIHGNAEMEAGWLILKHSYKDGKDIFFHFLQYGQKLILCWDPSSTGIYSYAMSVRNLFKIFSSADIFVWDQFLYQTSLSQRWPTDWTKEWSTQFQGGLRKTSSRKQLSLISMR